MELVINYNSTFIVIAFVIDRSDHQDYLYPENATAPVLYVYYV